MRNSKDFKNVINVNKSLTINLINNNYVRNVN